MRPAFYVLVGVLLVPTVGLVGDIVTDGKFKSTKFTGAPLEVASDDMVFNLNADMVDGVEGADLYTKSEIDAMFAALAVAVEPRRYYLTANESYGNQALTACASGFHMANVYELVIPSNLRYAYDHPDAFTRPDCGTGPPVANEGWIRTGSGAYTTGLGRGNCNVWSTTGALTGGTTLLLTYDWLDPTIGGAYYEVPGGAWYATMQDCNSTQKVWCIED